MIFKKFVFLIVLISLALAGCRTMKPLKTESTVEAPLPISRILKRVEAERRKIKTFKASGILKISSEKFNGKGSVEIVIKKPDSLKVSVFGPFGIELGEALVTPGSFYFYDAFRNRLFKGKNSEKASRKIFKLKYSLNELIDALTGYGNLSAELYKKPDSVKRENDWFSVAFSDSSGGTKQIFRIALGSHKMLLHSYLKEPDNIMAQNKFTDFTKINNINIPQKINISYGQKTKLKLEYRHIRINERIKSMKLNIPEDAKIIKW